MCHACVSPARRCRPKPASSNVLRRPWFLLVRWASMLSQAACRSPIICRTSARSFASLARRATRLRTPICLAMRRFAREPCFAAPMSFLRNFLSRASCAASPLAVAACSLTAAILLRPTIRVLSSISSRIPNDPRSNQPTPRAFPAREIGQALVRSHVGGGEAAAISPVVSSSSQQQSSFRWWLSWRTLWSGWFAWWWGWSSSRSVSSRSASGGRRTCGSWPAACRGAAQRWVAPRLSAARLGASRRGGRRRPGRSSRSALAGSQTRDSGSRRTRARS